MAGECTEGAVVYVSMAGQKDQSKEVLGGSIMRTWQAEINS
jgi:hypothetical protein